MTIENAIYSASEETGAKDGINCTIDGIQMSVPLDSANRHYAEILRQVEAGTLIIQEAS